MARTEGHQGRAGRNQRDRELGLRCAEEFSGHLSGILCHSTGLTVGGTRFIRIPTLARHQNNQPGESMTKRDLVIRISNETGLVQQSVLEVVQKTLDYIAEAVAQGK